MRSRLLGLLPASVLTFVCTVFGVALLQTGSAAAGPSMITVDVSAMRAGDVKVIPLSIDALGGSRWPVFVVDERDGRIKAFVGRAQGVKCPLAWTREPYYARMVMLGSVAFEDPCGGALFAIDGTCMDGPCTHSLDELRVTERGASASIDLTAIIPGRPGQHVPYK